ncbi:unnamed protein product, partial [Scytosiphon promiscuus]
AEEPVIHDVPCPWLVSRVGASFAATAMAGRINGWRPATPSIGSPRHDDFGGICLGPLHVLP